VQAPDGGWLRGKLCGKPYQHRGEFICIICNRRGEQPRDLCFPIKAANEPRIIS
jgi:hypothetical protein